MGEIVADIPDLLPVFRDGVRVHVLHLHHLVEDHGIGFVVVLADVHVGVNDVLGHAAPLEIVPDLPVMLLVQTLDGLENPSPNALPSVGIVLPDKTWLCHRLELPTFRDPDDLPQLVQVLFAQIPCGLPPLQAGVKHLRPVLFALHLPVIDRLELRVLLCQPMGRMPDALQ